MRGGRSARPATAVGIPDASVCSRPASRASRLVLPAVLGALILLAATLRAWVSDDAYLTFRTIDNFLGGLGLRWNAAERVQVYTHPLWMLLMIGARAVTREFFYSSIVLSLLLTAAAVLVFALRLARTPGRASLALALLLVSRAFLDYSTSGLENPLTHLLLALFLWVHLDEKPPTPGAVFRLSLIGALLAITRLDLIVLFAPALAWQLVRLPVKRAILAAALGALPLIAWEMFSVLYYGFLVANSAYAKLGTGLPRAELIRNGLAYVFGSLRLDPPTLPVIVAGILASLYGRRPACRALGAGIVLHIVYIVAVGGDFMSGRFLTAPLVLAVALLVRSVPDAAVVRWSACTIALAFGLWPLTSPFHMKPTYGSAWSRPMFDTFGIADERAMHFETASLWNAPSEGPWPNPERSRHASEIQADWTHHTWIPRLKFFGVVDQDEMSPSLALGSMAESAYRPVIVRGSVGVLGYDLGPRFHILDYLALGDPLLARLPALPTDPIMQSSEPQLAGLKFRTGHYARRIPAGYYETLIMGENRIRDPRLAAYYDHLATVTRAPLFDRGRLAEIWRINTGRYDDLLRAAAAQAAAPAHAPAMAPSNR